MSQTLTIKNFASPNIVEVSELTADVAAAATSFPLANVQGFAQDDYFVVGRLGGESSEQLIVSSVSSPNVVSTAGSARAHTKFEPVTKLFGNQIKIYRASNVDGSTPSRS